MVWRKIQWQAVSDLVGVFSAFSTRITNGQIPVPLPKGYTVYKQKISCFTTTEIRNILERADQKTFIGFRDYMMMLVFLDTGLRLAELSALQLSDILLNERCIRVSMGKGRKFRFVPLGSTCLIGLQNYIRLRGEPPVHDLWITRNNKPLQRGSILKIIRMYCRDAIPHGTRGSAHTFRHTMAKMYIRNGGDPFSLQQILGHSSLGMVQTYVRLFSNEVREQHHKYSPVEHMKLPQKTMN